MTDQDVLTAIQYTVVEPPNGGASWPSGLWTRDEVVGSLTQRQSKFLKDTLSVVNVVDNTTALQDTPPANPPILTVAASQTRITLPQDCARIVDLVWRNENGVIRELERADTYEVDHALETWEATGADLPLAYMEDAPSRVVQIAPMPAIAGTLELLYVPSGTPFNGNGVGFTVPDECVHAIKYGTLADLFGKDGQGKDPARAAYCEQRVQLAVDATRIILQGWA